jgi:hypothetical protein
VQSREHLGNIQGTFNGMVYYMQSYLQASAVQRTFREHSGNIQGTSREHPGNIQGTLNGMVY